MIAMTSQCACPFTSCLLVGRHVFWLLVRCFVADGGVVGVVIGVFGIGSSVFVVDVVFGGSIGDVVVAVTAVVVVVTAGVVVVMASSAVVVGVVVLPASAIGIRSREGLRLGLFI